MDDVNSIGSRIKHFRKLYNYTQKDLGKIVGVSSQVISNWERGYTTGIGPDELRLLARALKCSANDLVGNPEQPPVKTVNNENKELINKIKKLSPESYKELEKYIALLQLKDQLDKNSDETSAALTGNE